MIVTSAVTRGKKDIRQEQLTLEDPRPDEVLVKILSSGICRTDLEVVDGQLPLTPYPVVLGHEGAGIVEKVGSNVTSVAPGDTVILGAGACGTCVQCRAGNFAYCEQHVPMNFGAQRLDGSTALTDGNGEAVHSHFFSQSSWSTYAVAHQSNTIKVSSDLDPRNLGPFGCGIQTGAGAVLNVLDVQAGSSIAIFGTGAVGLAGVMAAKVSGASTIIAIGREDAQLALAEEVGATHTINSSGGVDVLEAVRAITGAPGTNYSLEATGAPEVMRLAVDVLMETGHAAITGVAAGKSFDVDIWTLLRGRTIHGTSLGDAVPMLLLPRLVDLYTQGRFPVDKIMTHYDLADIDRAIEDVNAGRVVKAVLHP